MNVHYHGSMLGPSRRRVEACELNRIDLIRSDPVRLEAKRGRLSSPSPTCGFAGGMTVFGQLHRPILISKDCNGIAASFVRKA